MSLDHLELALLIAYILLGPAAWWAYGWIVVASRRRMNLMVRPEADAPPFKRYPRVTILVPAKDEGERIRRCIGSCLAQDYPDFNVVAIDDRSSDDTGAVMDAMAAADPKLRVLHVTEPPAQGWTGKNNALHQGTKLADGEWLLFVDSDVVLEPDALSVSLAVARRKEMDLLSLLPRVESHTIWESTLIPIAGAVASSMYLIALNNNNLFTKTAFANGQFMLMSRSAYDTIGGHVAVRDRLCEDVAIARLMKQHNLRPRVSWGNEFASVRMYSSLGAIVNGWGRIYYAAGVGRPWRVLAAAAFVLLCCLSAWPALAWAIYRVSHPGAALWGYIGIPWWTTLAAHLGFMTYFLSVMYHWSGNPRRNALLFLPFGAPMLLRIFFTATKMCLTKKVEWRGTAYSHTMAPDLSKTPAAEAAARGAEAS